MPKEDNKVLEAKKTIFLSRFGMNFFKILLLGDLGTCPQNLIFTRGVEFWKKIHFPQGGTVVCRNSHTKAVFRQ
jgi:hypothetical protein